MKQLNYLMVVLTACALGAASYADAAPKRKSDTTEMTFDASDTDVQPIHQSGACTINIVSVSDERFTKDGIGADSAISTGPLEPWIDAGLDSLKQYGFTVQHSNSRIDDAINLNIKLIRAYTWHAPLRINGMVAMDVAFVTSQGVATDKFRASGSKANIADGESEHVTALNYAVTNMIHKLAPVLNQKCQALKTAVR